MTTGPELTGTAFIERGSSAYLRAVLALFCAGFATFALLYCVQPLLPQLAQQFALSSADSSLALSVTTFGMAGGMLLAGSLSDSLGRKRVMGTALLMACLCGLASALTSDWQWLLMFRCLLGVALSGLPAVAMAYIGEEFDPASLPVAMGLYIGGTALGGLLGRLLTGVLSDLGGWPLALGGIAGLGVLSLLLFICLLPASQHFRAQPMSLPGLAGSLWQNLATPALARLFVVSFLLMGSFVALFNYIGFYLSAEPFNLSPSWIGLLFVTYLAGIWSSAEAGRHMVRHGGRRVLRVSLLVMLAGVLLCALPWLPALVAGVLVFVTGFFAAHAAASSMVGQRAGQARAQASALYLCAYYLGSSTMGYGVGWVWQHWGWLAVIGCLALALLLALWRVGNLSSDQSIRGQSNNS